MSLSKERTFERIQNTRPPIGDQIKKLREQRGWSQRDLAKKCNYSIGFISKFENNTKGYDNPTLSTVEIFASSLGVDPYELLYGKVSPISKRLPLIRESKKISLKTLSKQSGISEEDLASYEQGLKSPNLVSLEKIARVLKVGVNELLENDFVERFVNFGHGPHTYIPPHMPEIGLQESGNKKFFDESGFPIQNESPRSFPRPKDCKDKFAYIVRMDFDLKDSIFERGTRFFCDTTQPSKVGDWVVVHTDDKKLHIGKLIYDNESIVLRTVNLAEEPLVLSKTNVRAVHTISWIRRHLPRW